MFTLSKPHHRRDLIASVYASPDRVDQLIRTALELDHDVEDGAALYGEHCASCHGPKALGNASKFIPALAGQRQAWLIRQLADFTEQEHDSRDLSRLQGPTRDRLKMRNDGAVGD